MKKYIVYLIILGIGLFLGKLLFGNASKKQTNHNTQKKNTIPQKWTCAMHPQIMQSKAGDCPICGMQLTLAKAQVDGLAPNQFKLTKNALALANVQTTVVGSTTNTDQIISLSGKIAENEQTNQVQVSYFTGRLEQLHINTTGESIRKGQLLATMYSPELIKAQQELLTASALKKMQPALYKAVRNKLRLWKLSQSQIHRIESSKKIQENIPVYATVSGTVLEKLVTQGDDIKQGQALFKVANLNTLWANFDVYESQIHHFKIGQTITITTNAYADAVFQAKISFIHPVLNPKTRTITIRAVLNNQKGLLKPQMFVTAKVNIKANKAQLWIPASAVLWTGKRSVVYVKPDPEQPIFEMREVLLGNKLAESYEIISGLQSKEEIVTSGVFTIDASAQLQGKKSMMHHKKEITEPFKGNEKFKSQLQKAYRGYIALKDNLVKSDSIATKKSALTLQALLQGINIALITNTKAHKQWEVLGKTLISSSDVIINTSDLKEQRKQFKLLSEHFILAVEAFGIQQTTYKQHCPMADTDTGAFWLSDTKAIANPYFGAQMLQCGQVKQILYNH